MRILLDTNIVVALLNNALDRLPISLRAALTLPETVASVSVASLWEIAIKVRLGKLNLYQSLDDLPRAIATFGLPLLPVEAHHALAEAVPVPPTRDPFDRLLLAICAVEGMRLLTTDGAMAGHPLAWRA